MPLLQLAGPWLGEAGFAPGDEVRVVVRQGRLLVVRRDLDPAWLDGEEV
ncbi:MAG: type I toxin-antitoxin system SymE family toxin [Thermoanaerobaculia bacterium]|nr:type I toxin-antitoxin system SymE family toxin [Thermoanaerobaculia bacterium]